MARDSIDLDLQTEPLPVNIGGKRWLFRPEIGAKELARLTRPLRDLGNATDVGEEQIDQMMGVLGDMLNDPAERPEWVALDLPTGHIMVLMKRLSEEYTGNPFGQS